MRITGNCKGSELNIKRFYMPGIEISDICPKCKTDWVHDFGDWPLNYPVVGEPIKITGYCESCYYEWDIGNVLINISLEEVK